MRPKLIATDLDGTLFGRDLQVSPRTLSAIARLHEAGIPFVMATGRMYRATLPYAKACGVMTPLITYQGALIRDPETGADLWHRTIATPLALRSLEALRETGLHVNVYIEDELLVERITPEAERYAEISGVAPRVVPSFEAVLHREPTKIVAIGEADAISRWVPAMRERFGPDLYVTESLPIFLELANPAISKSAALAHLADRLGIAASDVVAFGDGMNDLDMLEWAGLGVAMGNAPAAVREAADRVAPSVHDDGVASVLEELLS